MHTATIHQQRPILSVFSLLVAGAGVALATVAIATDDVSRIAVVPQSQTVQPSVEAPAAPAAPILAERSPNGCGATRVGVVERC
jgi:hypothetical protein